MNRLKHIKLRGSSIVEVLVALAISTICIYLGVAIFLGIQNSSRTFSRLKAAEFCEKYMDQTMVEKSYADQIFHLDNFSLSKTVTRHEELWDCYIVRLIVFDSKKKKIGELESVVFEK